MLIFSEVEQKGLPDFNSDIFFKFKFSSVISPSILATIYCQTHGDCWSPFCFQVNRKFLDQLYFRLHQSEVKRQNSRLIFLRFDQPGVVAHACNPATWRLGSLNGLRVGFLGAVVLCRSGVRAKFGVNMGNTEESEFSRLVKEERTGPGWKHSRQKLPRQTVVG